MYGSALDVHIESCCWLLFGLNESAVPIYLMAEGPSEREGGGGGATETDRDKERSKNTS